MIHNFIAHSLSNELELNKLAGILGINRKYRWEEPLVLTGKELRSLLFGHAENENVFVFLFSFGSVVFINCSEVESRKILEKLNQHIPGPENYLAATCVDSYSLEIDPNQPRKITNDYAILPEFRRTTIDMISIVIAKSVALERIEKTMEDVFDEVDEIVKMLAHGKLGVKNKRIAKLVARVLDIKLSILSYIMVLDKPDLTWHNILVDQFYIEMAELFELIDRYEDIKHKTEVLKDAIDAFANLAHSERATRQELAIIYLILFEILIYFWELGHPYVIDFFKSLF